MNIRDAILASANQIERENSCYTFLKSSVPACGTPGCMLGWIGYFLGVEVGSSVSNVASYDMKLPEAEPNDYGWASPEGEFYRRIVELGGREDGSYTLMNPGEVVRCLRLYVAKYHPSEGIPDSVRSIFTLTNEQLREALAA